MILYEKKGCWHCKLVEDMVTRLGLNPERRYISDPKVVEELIARGGRRQVPYMVDEERKVSMYESKDIAAYLAENYSK